MTQLAIIRIRGEMHITKPIKDTMDMLRLRKKHTCVVLEDTPIVKGMLRKAKDYITWGEVNEESLKLLNAKRAREVQDGKVIYHLAPPKGGFERKGIKTSFANKGALGYRGEKINALIHKMI